jgi:hypothetical protein
LNDRFCELMLKAQKVVATPEGDALVADAELLHDAMLELLGLNIALDKCVDGGTHDMVRAQRDDLLALLKESLTWAETSAAHRQERWGRAEEDAYLAKARAAISRALSPIPSNTEDEDANPRS